MRANGFSYATDPETHNDLSDLSQTTHCFEQGSISVRNLSIKVESHALSINMPGSRCQSAGAVSQMPVVSLSQATQLLR